MISVGYITAPRPQPTIAASLLSLKNAGFPEDVLVCSEPGVGFKSPIDCTLLANPQKLGNLRNWVSCAEHLLRWDDADEWIMVCEDDINWARNAYDVLCYDLKNFAVENVQAISLFCPDKMVAQIQQVFPSPRGLTHGWYPLLVGKQMWGAQCLVMRKEWLYSLLACDYFKGKLANMELDKNIDRFIAESAQKRDARIAYRIPCLVDHKMGDKNSSLYGDRDRPALRCRYFKDPAE